METQPEEKDNCGENVAAHKFECSSSGRRRERITPVNGKEQGQSCHCFFPSRQVRHRLEPFARRYAIIVNSIEVGLLGIFGTQERLGRLVLGQRLLFRVKHERKYGSNKNQSTVSFPFCSLDGNENKNRNKN